jgi:hypothetical protein
MFCPECGCEFRPEIQECSDCRAPLVESLPEPEPFRDVSREPVTVLQTSDSALVALASSILESAGIPFAVRGEGIQDLLGWGRISGFNPATGAARIDVAAEDAAVARLALEDLEQEP